MASVPPYTPGLRSSKWILPSSRRSRPDAALKKTDRSATIAHSPPSSIAGVTPSSTAEKPTACSGSSGERGPKERGVVDRRVGFPGPPAECVSRGAATHVFRLSPGPLGNHTILSGAALCPARFATQVLRVLVVAPQQRYPTSSAQKARTVIPGPNLESIASEFGYCENWPISHGSRSLPMAALSLSSAK